MEFINRAKFFRFRICGSGHTSQFFIHTKIVLESDAREGLIFIFYFYALFRLQRLMQSIAVAPSCHHATGELIDNDDFPILHHIVHFIFKQAMCFNPLIKAMKRFYIGRIIKVLQAQQFFHDGNPLIRQGSRLGFFINQVMFFFFQFGDDLVHRVIFFRGFFRLTRNN